MICHHGANALKLVYRRISPVLSLISDFSLLAYHCPCRADTDTIHIRFSLLLYKSLALPYSQHHCSANTIENCSASWLHSVFKMAVGLQ